MILFYVFYVGSICFSMFQEGRTPLHYSAALNDSGIFYRYLLKCGADEHIQDKVAWLAYFQKFIWFPRISSSLF